MCETLKISIVLPTYNGVRYLNDSIRSCLNQSYNNIELIVVDDGSTVCIPDTLNQYNDPRLSYIRKENNSGLPDSLNLGFKASKGDYLTWTSDDNYYHENALKIMSDRLNCDKKIGLVYSNYELIDENGATKETVNTGMAEDLYFHNCIGPCFLYRRKVFEKIGEYDKNCTLVEDYDYWLRAWKCFRMAKIDKCLYSFRLHQSSLTGKYDKSNFLREQLALVKKKNLSKSMYLLSKSRELFSQNNKRNSIKYAFSSICFNPINMTSWKMLLIILKNHFFNECSRYK